MKNAATLSGFNANFMTIGTRYI